MSQSVQDPAQLGEDDMGEAFGPLPVNKLEVSSAADSPSFALEYKLTSLIRHHTFDIAGTSGLWYLGLRLQEVGRGRLQHRGKHCIHAQEEPSPRQGNLGGKGRQDSC